MESIIQKAISQWSQEKGINPAEIKNIQVRWSEPKIGFHSINFTVNVGLVVLKIIDKGAGLKIIESLK
jgi:hypothetical protein